MLGAGPGPAIAATGRRGERLDRLAPPPPRPGHPHTCLQLRLTDVQPRAPLNPDLHQDHPFSRQETATGPGGCTGIIKTSSHVLTSTITGTCHAATASGYESGSRHQCGTTSPDPPPHPFSSIPGGPSGP